MTIPLLLLAAAFLLILANGFFVAAEFGLVTVERPDAERAAADGDRRARTRRRRPAGAVLPALRHPARHHHHLPGRRHARRARARRAAGRPAAPRPACPRAPSPASPWSSACCWPPPSRWSIGELVPEELGDLPAAAGRPVRRRPAARLHRRSSGPVIAAAQHRRQPPRARAWAWSPPRSWPPPAPPANWSRSPGTPPRPAPWSRTPPTCSSAPSRWAS